MTKQKETVTIKRGVGATPIDADLLAALVGQEAIAAGEKRLASEHRGPWGICTSLSGLVVSWNSEADTLTIYGNRKASAVKEAGFAMEGRVSVGGRKRTCFTSSRLFELPNGHLVDVATLCLHDDQV